VWRVLRILYVTLILRCPACQRGAMFRSLFQMNVRCPVCNVVFERDHGEITGGMAINTVVVCSLGVLGGVLAVVTDIPTGWDYPHHDSGRGRILSPCTRLVGWYHFFDGFHV
jgi:uncharacterized protein (DUF983 family)